MYFLLKKILFSLDPEVAHDFVKKTSPLFPALFFKKLTKKVYPRLKTTLGALDLANPIGLAAGFDKNGEMISLMESLGFGFVEIGSVTASPSQGNPKPRIFRLPQDESLINRMGLPNWGADAVAEQLAGMRHQVPLGINIAKTPSLHSKSVEKGMDDYLTSFSKLFFCADYMVLNLSCPNTSDGRTFEDPAVFAELALAIKEKRKGLGFRKPVLIKVSPDSDEKNLDRLVSLALDHGFDGFVVSNTTAGREGLKTKHEKVEKMGRGGLSGGAVAEKADLQLCKVFERVGRGKILMGVGGIMCFESLLRKLAFGANYFQLYTGLIYRGPFFVCELAKKLDDFCGQMGVANYQELVGKREVLDAVRQRK